ncbi:hypothetical protein [Pelagovum pacificum]|uniref:Uncharacterized protein n=1 Tax=Pelagovum pacificum TaxID=2588711 RepID=A0A5C5GDV5_9RHOB|nr:hypothetical protein [Pelagovum pacificum]QQA43969.1 hypothetical protein I8N54_05155 [Pelagovum pacificum]TNY32903.1 hypothetical protein FHY64_06400 [Pelagovum pacificum]
MEWTIANVALLISASATAITSVISVPLPILRDWINQNNGERRARYEVFSNLVKELITNLDEVKKADRSYEMHSAYILANKPIDPQPQMEIDLRSKFNRDLNLLKLLAPETGVDATDFIRKVEILRLTTNGYAVENDKLVAKLDGSEVARTIVSLQDDIVNEGVDVLERARQALRYR